MRKIITVAGAIALAAVFLSLALIVYVPLPYNHTMNAVKLDSDGNEIGNVQITIKGTKWSSLLLQDRLIADCGAFDSISGFDIDSVKYTKNLTADILQCTFSITNIGSDESIEEAIQNGLESLSPTSYLYHISVSEDFSRWLIHVEVNGEADLYYLASVNDKHTSIELAEFFADFLP